MAISSTLLHPPMKKVRMKNINVRDLSDNVFVFKLLLSLAPRETAHMQKSANSKANLPFL